jgi:hypothetical protein
MSLTEETHSDRIRELVYGPGKKLRRSERISAHREGRKAVFGGEDKDKEDRGITGLITELIVKDGYVIHMAAWDVLHGPNNSGGVESTEPNSGVDDAIYAILKLAICIAGFEAMRQGNPVNTISVGDHHICYFCFEDKMLLIELDPKEKKIDISAK